MRLVQYRMKCVPRPKTSREPNVWLRDIRLADYEEVQKHRKTMIQAIHTEIEEYLNIDGLYYEGEEDGFPNRSHMTGEYYLSNESYQVMERPHRFQISIMCHCLGTRVSKVDDYLGLEVWLECKPREWKFQVFRNTDSSSI